MLLYRLYITRGKIVGWWGWDFCENRCGVKMDDDEFLPFSSFFHIIWLVGKKSHFSAHPTNPFVENACGNFCHTCTLFFLQHSAGWWHEVVPDQVRWNPPELSAILFTFSVPLEPKAASGKVGKLEGWGSPRMQKKSWCSPTTWWGFEGAWGMRNLFNFFCKTNFAYLVRILDIYLLSFFHGRFDSKGLKV